MSDGITGESAQTIAVGQLRAFIERNAVAVWAKLYADIYGITV